MRKTWIDIGHDDLSVRRQSVLLRVNRNRLEVKPRQQTSVDLEICREIDELHLKHPQFGSRSMSTHLKKRGYSVGRSRQGPSIDAADGPYRHLPETAYLD